uniref:C2 domain-containing protein n=1 Tax=Crocodylus porosus TaxID=8502 RepID=A0A7M4EMG4_CROPO
RHLTTCRRSSLTAATPENSDCFSQSLNPRSDAEFWNLTLSNLPASETILSKENANSHISMAALSLPHFPKAQSFYGFYTLRRKESIFHSDPSSLTSCLLVPPNSGVNTCYKRLASSPINTRHSSGYMYSQRQTTWDCDTGFSTDSSPFSFPFLKRSLSRSYPSVAVFSSEGSVCRRRQKKQIQRAKEHSSSPEEVSESTVFLDRNEILRLSSKYCHDRRNFRIHLISAEGLYDASIGSTRVNCCIIFCLVPGKTQKQRSTIIKRSRNPIFNEHFVFNDIAKNDLLSQSVKIIAVNKAFVKRHYILGKCQLCLVSML